MGSSFDYSATGCLEVFIAGNEICHNGIAKLAMVPDRDLHWVGRKTLRGTLATSVGATSQLVASTLGHASIKVTERHYTKPEAIDSAKTKTALGILEGGRKC